MSTPVKGHFRWYCVGVVSQFVPFGLHSVLFAWMVAVMLDESGLRLGLAQMSAQLPGLIFILFGGLLADRVDRRQILITFHCLAALPVLLLVLLIHADMLNYYLVVGYAVLLGIASTFLQPARDSLLNQVADSNLQRAVTIVMGLNFASQVIGYGLASLADTTGPLPLLVIQGAGLLLGAAVALKLPVVDVPAASLETRRELADQGPLGQIGEGLALIYQSSRMFPVMVLMLAVGVFYVGAFSVISPIIVRDVYGGGSSDIALSYICFMVGTIATTVLLVSFGGIQRQGLGLMLALLSGGVFLALASIGLSFTGYLICLSLWGVSGGVAMSLGRAIVQESAPDSHRARVLSVYSLGTLGGMPLGSVLMGWCIVTVGPLPSLLVAVIGVAVTVCLVWLTTDLTRVERYAN